MQKQLISKNLIEINFLDNDALKKYLDICVNNLTRKKEKFKTQSHHIIPVCYYKKKYNCKSYNEAKKHADNDPNNIRVNLLFSDHILVHYYLSQCCSEDLKYSIYSSLYRMISIKDSKVSYCINKYLKLDDLIKITKYLLKNIDLSIYQKNYEEYLKLNSEKNSNWHKGKKSWIAGKHHSSESRLKNSLAHLGKPSKVKGIPRSEETRKKISNVLKGRDLSNAAGKIYIKKEGIVKRISPNDLDIFMAQGWEKGRYPISPEIVNKRKKHVYTEAERQAISKRNKGRKRTEEQKRINSEAHKGKIPWNKGKKGEGNSCYGKYAITNGIITKFWKDEFGPLPDTFIKGTTRKNKASIPKGTRRWYTNGIKDTLAENCPEGFILGRVTAKGKIKK